MPEWRLLLSSSKPLKRHPITMPARRSVFTYVAKTSETDHPARF